MNVEDNIIKTLYAIGEIAKILQENDLTIICRKIDGLYSIGFIIDREHAQEKIEDTIVAELDHENIFYDVNKALREQKGE